MDFQKGGEEEFKVFRWNTNSGVLDDELQFVVEVSARDLNTAFSRVFDWIGD